MIDYKLKRKRIEHRSLQTLLTYGRLRFYLEDFEPLRPILKLLLLMTGTLGRGYRNAQDLRIRKVPMVFEDLPAAFSGYRILFLSDIHVDGLPDIAGIVARLVRDIDADLCLLGGDYRFEVFGSSDKVLAGMGQIIRSVRARDGLVGVLGNHDFAEIGAGLSAFGVRMLFNEAIELRRGGDSIWLAGLDDPHFYRCDDIDAASAGIPADAAFRMILVHTPELYREAEARGYRLYLAGHTHGGQICTPWGKPILVHARCPRRYARGLWQHGRMTGYTTSGAGASLLPVRFNCPPEVALIEIHSG